MQNRVYSNNFSSAQVSNFIHEINLNGYTKVDNFLKKKYISILLDKINSIYSKSSKTSFFGLPNRDFNDKIIYNLQNKDHLFNNLLIDPLIKKIAINKLNDQYYRFLPKNVPNYTLKFFNARSSGNKLDLHIDSYFPYKGDRTIMMQFAVVLEESNKSNGCTVVVPKSHKSGKYSNRESKNIKHLDAKPGDLLVWDSRTWHGTTNNKSDLSRWAIIMTFGQWWIKPSMEITNSISQKNYSKLNNMQKQLLGFCSITPSNENQRINTKNGYNFLKKNLKDYI
jgi:ectoine hydroxylase-related dioxygenase (phytanoyl-CoA dioxygenase family)